MDHQGAICIVATVIGDILRHPLVILLAGGFLTGWLVPRITRRWQDQRNALEIKADLIERVASAVTEISTATLFALDPKSQGRTELAEAYRSWQHDRAVLTHLIKVYFRSKALDNQWLRCGTLATAYVIQLGILDKKEREGFLEFVERELSLPVPLDGTELRRDPLGNPLAEFEHEQEVQKLRDTIAANDPEYSGPPLELFYQRENRLLRMEIKRVLDETVQLAIDTPVVIVSE